MSGRPPDPFVSDIVYEPRRVTRAVASLNEVPLNELLDRFDSLEQTTWPRGERRLEHAQFLASAEPGYGKSHLIGRLFQKLSGRANLIYVPPFVDPGTSWKSILMRLVQELDFPEHLDVENRPAGEPTQLEAMAHGVLVNLLIATMGRSAGTTAKIEQYIQRLREKTLLALRQDAFYPGIIARRLPGWADQIKARIKTYASLTSWLAVLNLFAYRPGERVLRDAARDWLQGGSLGPEEARAIGLRAADIPRPDAPITEANESCRRRIIDFCLLAGLHRPFVFCFDQTENYANDPALARALGLVIETFCREAANQLTLVTANVEPWRLRMAPHWEGAHQDRLRRPPLQLAGLDRTQAEDLIALRLAEAGRTQDLPANMADSTWLDEVFHGRGEIGIRTFLKKCHARWLEGRAEQADPGSLERIFKKNINDVQSQPKRMIFDRDALLWLVSTAVARRPDLAVTPAATSGEGVFFPWSWRIGDGTIRLAFESGSDWKRWWNLVEESQRRFQMDPGHRAVVFRTPGLPHIPKPSWAKTGPLIDQAKRTFLHILELTEEETVRIYAAHDLYRDAVSGNIEYQSDQILDFLPGVLDSIWRRALAPPAVPAPAQSAPSPELIDRVRLITSREKFISISDLMARLGSSWSEEEVSRVRDFIPEITIKAFPNMTVLLWHAEG